MLRAAGMRSLKQSFGQVARATALQQRFQETKAADNKLDWDALQDFVTSDDGKRELAALRTTYIDLQSRGEGQKSISVNWEQYKGEVEPETLAMFQKAYTGLKFPSYDASKDVEEARAAFKPLYKQAEELAAFSEKRLKEIEIELKAIANEKEKITQLTIDEELANDPETAKEIDKEISEGNFLP